MSGVTKRHFIDSEALLNLLESIAPKIFGICETSIQENVKSDCTYYPVTEVQSRQTNKIGGTMIQYAKRQKVELPEMTATSIEIRRYRWMMIKLDSVTVFKSALENYSGLKRPNIITLKIFLSAP